MTADCGYWPGVAPRAEAWTPRLKSCSFWVIPTPPWGGWRDPEGWKGFRFVLTKGLFCSSEEVITVSASVSTDSASSAIVFSDAFFLAKPVNWERWFKIAPLPGLFGDRFGDSFVGVLDGVPGVLGSLFRDAFVGVFDVVGLAAKPGVCGS